MYSCDAGTILSVLAAFVPAVWCSCPGIFVSGVARFLVEGVVCIELLLNVGTHSSTRYSFDSIILARVSLSL